MVRRVLGTTFLLVAAVFAVRFYHDANLVAAAKGELSAEARIGILEAGVSKIFLNDELYRFLGKAHFEAGTEKIENVHLRDARKNVRPPAETWNDPRNVFAQRCKKGRLFQQFACNQLQTPLLEFYRPIFCGCLCGSTHKSRTCAF